MPKIAQKTALLLPLLILSMTLVLVYGQTTKDRAREYYERGNVYYQQGNYKEAQEEYNKAMDVLSRKEEPVAQPAGEKKRLPRKRPLRNQKRHRSLRLRRNISSAIRTSCIFRCGRIPT